MDAKDKDDLLGNRKFVKPAISPPPRCDDLCWGAFSLSGTCGLCAIAFMMPGLT
jgi:hypothetical protein